MRGRAGKWGKLGRGVNLPRVWVNYAKVISVVQHWKGLWGGSAASRC